MISERIIQELNKRIQREQYSSRVYYAMYLWLRDKGYEGAAKLWKKYSEEEMKHATWAEDFLDSFNIKPELMALEEPPCEFEGLGDVIRKSLEHEIVITKECNDLAGVCLADMNFNSYDLAMKYVHEQTEEISKLNLLLNRLELFGEDPISLRLFDQELEKLA
jgi:ferritin